MSRTAATTEPRRRGAGTTHRRAASSGSLLVASASAGVDANVIRAALPGSTIEAAGESDGQFRIRGVANTLQVMRSGKLFSRRAFDRFLKTNKTIDLPLLANHGVDRGGFNSVGRVDRLSVDRKRGLLFEGWIGAGTEIADDARSLIKQGVVKHLSVGWIVRQARFIRKDDKDIDADIAEQLAAAGVDEAFVFLDVDLVEISAVDVPDDPGAGLLAARLADETFDRLQELVGERPIVGASGERYRFRPHVLAEACEGVLRDYAGDALEAALADFDGPASTARKAIEAAIANLRRDGRASAGGVIEVGREEFAEILEETWAAAGNDLFDCIESVVADPDAEYGRLTMGDADLSGCCGHASAAAGDSALDRMNKLAASDGPGANERE